MASSSAHNHHHHHLPYATISAPPPTPSTQPNLLSTPDSSADPLSLLLHRLPPTLSLSLPSRLSPHATTTTTTTTTPPPIISLSDDRSNLLSASSQLGFFQLTHHSIPTHLAHSAESNSFSLLTNLTRDQKHISFPKNWPLGFDHDEEDDEPGTGESFCLDSSCSTESTELNLSHLREFTREMEKVGLEVLEALSCAVGFENPVREDPGRVCSLMWISEGSTGNKQAVSGKFYPYVVGLHYQIRCQKYSVLADSGWVCVSPQVDSVLVTLGDIAQVWSNGKLKKVRGRPVPVPCPGDDNNPPNISMSLLVTLPLDSTVYPLLPCLVSNVKEDEINKEENKNSDNSEEERVFNSFSFEDFAWRVYHERILLKDPLGRYRI